MQDVQVAEKENCRNVQVCGHYSYSGGTEVMGVGTMILL
jgi:hypothetical protein